MMDSYDAIDAKTAEELEKLIREFPDWKERHPELYNIIYPPIHSRTSRKHDNNNNNENQGSEHHVTFDDVTQSPGFPVYSRHAAAPASVYYGSTRPPGVAKFSGLTTSKEHYKWWNSSPVAPFSELPAFSNYLIYPGRGRQFSTTTQSTFRGEPGERPLPIKPPESDILPTTRVRMEMNTATGMAFPGYHNAAPAHLVDRTPRDTSYITTYIQNKDAQTEYLSAPLPQHNSAAYRSDVKFDGRTMNQDHFRAWPIEPRPQYGDRYEVPYLPSTCRFDGTTTNSMTYRGQQLGTDSEQQPTAGRPTRQAGSLPRSDMSLTLTQLADRSPRDFTTAYKSDYNRPNAIRNLSKSQAAMLLRELRMRRRQRETTENSGKSTGAGRSVALPVV